MYFYPINHADMAKGLASINIKFSVDLKQFSTELQNSMREIDKFGKKASELGRSMSLYITTPVVAAGAASVKLASDYQESLNKVDVAFGVTSGRVKEFARTSLTSFGIAEGTALDMAATFGDMATSMGLPQAKAAQMSTSLVGLAGDLASFKNIGISEATTALNGVFTGETESLKKLGIVMTEANLQAFALTKGIKVQIKDMDQASKVNLRYAYIMQATKNAQGDFARTGGGAANQMRIFQESLKQLGQQFGQVILPYFTKLISSVNGIISGFSKLSPEIKTAIVIVGGVAAAMGLALIIIGQMSQGIPVLVSAFGKLKTAMSALALSVNPYVLLAGAIAAIGVAVYAWYSNNAKLVSSQQALNNAIAKGNEQAASEVVELDKLYNASQDVKLGIDDRKKAVDELQSRYPAYFGNIKDEIILNGKAASQYTAVRDAIFAKARAQAIEIELQSRAQERLKTEVELRQKIADTEADIAAKKKGSAQITLQEASASEKTLRVTISKTDYLLAANKRLADLNKQLKDFKEKSYNEDKILLDQQKQYADDSQKLTENEKKLAAEKAAAEAAALADSIKLQGQDAEAKKGTIAYYEAMISNLRKQQNEVVTTQSGWSNLEAQIADYQKRIDAISKSEIKLPKPAIVGADSGIETPMIDNNLKALKDQVAYYERLREQFSKTSKAYQAFSETINGIKLKIGEIEGVDQLQKVPQVIDETAAAQERAAELGQRIGQAFGDAFSALSNRFVESLGLAKDGYEGFVGTLAATVIKLISMMLASSIAQAIPGAVAAGAATGPAAPFTTPAYIAEAISGVLMAFASIPKFATGGVVGGSSMFGDKILARVNSGELILNQNQQAVLASKLDSSAVAPIFELVGGWTVKGTDIQFVLERVGKKQQRTG